MTTLYSERPSVRSPVIIDVIEAEESYDAFAATDAGQIASRVVLQGAHAVFPKARLPVLEVADFAPGVRSRAIRPTIELVGRFDLVTPRTQFRPSDARRGLSERLVKAAGVV
jgi:hypothetical protein